jgi:hypothetical protein
MHGITRKMIVHATRRVESGMGKCQAMAARVRRLVEISRTLLAWSLTTPIGRRTQF